MKFNKTIIAGIALAFSLVFSSCVDDQNFSVPNSTGTEENQNLTKVLDSITSNQLTLLSVADVKSNFFTTRKPKKVEGNYVVKGYVTSSDESGNFYKEFFMQDTPENPTAGIRVALNMSSSYTIYNIGREVYIRLKGLYVGESRAGDGVATIGGFLGADLDEIENMSENQIPSHIFRSATTETLVPLSTTFSTLSAGNIGMFVEVNDVHFKGANGLTYFDPNRDFDTQRTLEGCDGFGYAEFILETSSFSNFGSTLLPSEDKWGSIAGIITNSYNGSKLLMTLNSVEDVKMTGSACTPLNINDFTVKTEEDFQTVTHNSTLRLTDWKNITTEGTKKWIGKKFRGNGYTEFSPYRSNESSNVGWLVAPVIDLNSSNSAAYLNFKTAQHHVSNDKLNTLEVFVSTDFDGTNIGTATWTPLSDAVLANKNDSNYEFKDSGLIDISSYIGRTVYVAFKAVGGNAAAIDGAYMVDDYRVLVK